MATSKSITTKIIEYPMRVGKSLALGVFDGFIEQVPMIASCIESNKETVKQLYKDIVVSKQPLKRLQQMQDQYIFKPVNQAFQNIKSDLKSGVFYHPEREAAYAAAAEESMMASLLAEAGMDGLEDGLTGEEQYTQEELEQMPVQPIAQVTSGDALVASTIAKEQRANTNALISAQTQLLEAQMQSQKTINTLNQRTSQRLLGATHTGFQRVIEGINQITNFNQEVLLTHANNSKQYYESMTKLTQENNAIFKELLDMRRNIYKKETEQQEDDSAFKNGVFNLKGYINQVKKNLEGTMLGQAPMLIGMMQGVISGIIANPIHAATKYLTQTLMGIDLRSALAKFDSSVMGYIETSLARLWEMGKMQNQNIILETLGQVFGLDVSKKSLYEADTTKMFKGARSWDAEDHMYLTKIIPSYLSNIESALTGEQARVFSKETGKFETQTTMVMKAHQEEQDAANAAAAPMMNKIIKMLQATGQVKTKEEELSVRRALAKFNMGAQQGFGHKGVVLYEKNPDGSYKKDENGKLIPKLDEKGMTITSTDPMDILERNEGNKFFSNDIEKRQMMAILKDIIEMDPGIISQMNQKNFEFIRQHNNRIKSGNLDDAQAMEAMRAFATSTGISSYEAARDIYREAGMENDINYDQLGQLLKLTKDSQPAGWLKEHPLMQMNKNNPFISYQDKILRVLLDIRDGRRAKGPGIIGRFFGEGKSSRDISNIGNNAGGLVDAQGNALNSTQTLRLQEDLSLENTLLRNGSFDFQDFQLRQMQEIGKVMGVFDKLKSRKDLDQDTLKRFLDIYKDKGKDVLENIKRENRVLNENFLDSTLHTSDTEEQADQRLMSLDLNPKDGFLTNFQKAEGIGEKLEVISSSINKIISTPRTLLTSVIMTADKLMYEVLFGKPQLGPENNDPNNPKGLFGKMSKAIDDGAKALSKGLKNFADKVFDEHGTWGKIKKSVSRWTDPLKEGFKNGIGSFFTDIKDSFTGTFHDITGGRFRSNNQSQEEPEQHADGTPGTGDHYAFVSKGEAILPKEINPFIKGPKATSVDQIPSHGTPFVNANTDADVSFRKIHKGDAVIPADINPWNPNRDKVNRKEQRAKETLAKRKMISDLKARGSSSFAAGIKNYADGNEEADPLSNTIKIVNLLSKELPINELDEIIEEMQAVMPQFDPNSLKNMFAGWIGESLKENIAPLLGKDEKKEMFRMFRNIRRKLKDHPQFLSAIDKVAIESGIDPDKLENDEQLKYRDYNTGEGPLNGIKAFMMQATGTDPEKAAEQLHTFVTKNTPEMAKGGAAGALIGTLFPLGGPILGAMGGIVTSLLGNNKSFMKYVFGTEITDNEGNLIDRKNDGLISRKFMKTMEKYMPDIKKYGITGSLIGLVTPFGPLGGLMAGVAGSIIKNNETVNNFLFGDEHGLLNKDRKSAIKRALPHIGVGLLSTFFLGPFGLLGNAALGAGLGMLSTTETFKKIMLGAKDKDGVRHGGIAGAIRRHIIFPLKDTMNDLKKNFGNWFKRSVFNPISRGMSAIGGYLRDAMKEELKSGMGWIRKKFFGPGTFLEKAINKVFLGIRKVGSLAKWTMGIPKWLIEKGAGAVGFLGDQITKSRIESGSIAKSGKSATEIIADATRLGLDKTGYKNQELYHTIANNEDRELIDSQAKRAGNIALLLSGNTEEKIADRQQKEFDFLKSAINALGDDYEHGRVFRDHHDDLMSMIEGIQNSSSAEEINSKLEAIRDTFKRQMTPKELEKLMDTLTEHSKGIYEATNARKLWDDMQKGGGAADKEIEELRQQLAPNMPFDQFKEKLPMIAELLKNENEARNKLYEREKEQNERNGIAGDVKADSGLSGAENVDLILRNKDAAEGLSTALEFLTKTTTDNSDALTLLKDKFKETAMVLSNTGATLLQSIHQAAANIERITDYQDERTQKVLQNKKSSIDKFNRTLNVEDTVDMAFFDEETAAQIMRQDNDKWRDRNRRWTKNLNKLQIANSKGNDKVISDMKKLWKLDPEGYLMERVTLLTITGVQVSSEQYENIMNLPDAGFKCALELSKLGGAIQDFSMFDNIESEEDPKYKILLASYAVQLEFKDDFGNRTEGTLARRLLVDDFYNRVFNEDGEGSDTGSVIADAYYTGNLKQQLSHQVNHPLSKRHWQTNFVDDEERDQAFAVSNRNMTLSEINNLTDSDKEVQQGKINEALSRTITDRVTDTAARIGERASARASQLLFTTGKAVDTVTRTDIGKNAAKLAYNVTESALDPSGYGTRYGQYLVSNAVEALITKLMPSIHDNLSGFLSRATEKAIANPFDTINDFKNIINDMDKKKSIFGKGMTIFRGIKNWVNDTTGIHWTKKFDELDDDELRQRFEILKKEYKEIFNEKDQAVVEDMLGQMQKLDINKPEDEQEYLRLMEHLINMQTAVKTMDMENANDMALRIKEDTERLNGNTARSFLNRIQSSTGDTLASLREMISDKEESKSDKKPEEKASVTDEEGNILYNTEDQIKNTQKEIQDLKKSIRETVNKIAEAQSNDDKSTERQLEGQIDQEIKTLNQRNIAIKDLQQNIVSRLSVSSDVGKIEEIQKELEKELEEIKSSTIDSDISDIKNFDKKRIEDLEKQIQTLKDRLKNINQEQQVVENAEQHADGTTGMDADKKAFISGKLDKKKFKLPKKLKQDDEFEEDDLEYFNQEEEKSDKLVEKAQKADTFAGGFLEGVSNFASKGKSLLGSVFGSDDKKENKEEEDNYNPAIVIENPKDAKDHIKKLTSGNPPLDQSMYNGEDKFQIIPTQDGVLTYTKDSQYKAPMISKDKESMETLSNRGERLEREERSTTALENIAESLKQSGKALFDKKKKEASEGLGGFLGGLLTAPLKLLDLFMSPLTKIPYIGGAIGGAYLMFKNFIGGKAKAVGSLAAGSLKKAPMLLGKLFTKFLPPWARMLLLALGAIFGIDMGLDDEEGDKTGTSISSHLNKIEKVTDAPREIVGAVIDNPFTTALTATSFYGVGKTAVSKYQNRGMEGNFEQSKSNVKAVEALGKNVPDSVKNKIKILDARIHNSKYPREERMRYLAEQTRLTQDTVGKMEGKIFDKMSSDQISKFRALKAKLEDPKVPMTVKKEASEEITKLVSETSGKDIAKKFNFASIAKNSKSFFSGLKSKSGTLGAIGAVGGLAVGAGTYLYTDSNRYKYKNFEKDNNIMGIKHEFDAKKYGMVLSYKEQAQADAYIKAGRSPKEIMRFIANERARHGLDINTPYEGRTENDRRIEAIEETASDIKDKATDVKNQVENKADKLLTEENVINTTRKTATTFAANSLMQHYGFKSSTLKHTGGSAAIQTAVGVAMGDTKLDAVDIAQDYSLAAVKTHGFNWLFDKIEDNYLNKRTAERIEAEKAIKEALTEDERKAWVKSKMTAMSPTASSQVKEQAEKHLKSLAQRAYDRGVVEVSMKKGLSETVLRFIGKIITGEFSLKAVFKGIFKAIARHKVISFIIAASGISAFFPSDAQARIRRAGIQEELCIPDEAEVLEDEDFGNIFICYKDNVVEVNDAEGLKRLFGPGSQAWEDNKYKWLNDTLGTGVYLAGDMLGSRYAEKHGAGFKTKGLAGGLTGATAGQLWNSVVNGEEFDLATFGMNVGLNTAGTLVTNKLNEKWEARKAAKAAAEAASNAGTTVAEKTVTTAGKSVMETAIENTARKAAQSTVQAVGTQTVEEAANKVTQKTVQNVGETSVKSVLQDTGKISSETVSKIEQLKAASAAKLEEAKAIGSKAIVAGEETAGQVAKKVEELKIIKSDMIESASKTLDQAKNTITETTEKAATLKDKAIDKLKSLSDIAKDKGSKIINTGKQAAQESAALLEQYLAKCKELLNGLYNAAAKYFPKVDVKGAINAIWALIENKIRSPEVAKRVVQAIVRSAGAIAAGSVSFGIGTLVVTGAFMTYEFSQGWSHAEELLKIPAGTATKGMKLFAASVNALLGANILGIAVAVIGPDTLMEYLLKKAKDIFGAEWEDLKKLQQQKKQENIKSGAIPTDEEIKEIEDKEIEKWKQKSLVEQIKEDGVGATVSRMWTVVKSKARNFFFGEGKQQNLNQSTTGKGKSKYGRSKNQYYSQWDNQYQMNMNIPGDTETKNTANAGCGPMAAENALASLGMNTDPKRALRFATGRSKSYQEQDGGTYPEFFHDYFHSQGLKTHNVTNKQDAIQSLQQGPVIFMGEQNENNYNMNLHGKEDFYGDGAHYITGTGYDPRTNKIRIVDSDRGAGKGAEEMWVPASSVLDRSSLAIAAGKGKENDKAITSAIDDYLNKQEDKTGRGVYGRSFDQEFKRSADYEKFEKSKEEYLKDAGDPFSQKDPENMRDTPSEIVGNPDSKPKPTTESTTTTSSEQNKPQSTTKPKIGGFIKGLGELSSFFSSILNPFSSAEASANNGSFGASGGAVDTNYIKGTPIDSEVYNRNSLGTPKYITIHHTTNKPADDTVENLKEENTAISPSNPDKCPSYHFIIYPNGEVHYLREETTLGQHTGGHNSNNLGIALSGHYCTTSNNPPYRGDKPTEAMIKSLERLVSDLTAKYGISLDRDHIVGHGEWYTRLAPESNGTECPGDLILAKLDSVVENAKKLKPKTQTNSTPASSTGSNIPQYKQYDDKWNGSDSRWPGGLKRSGCSPTSTAIQASYMTGKNITPVDVGNWAVDQGLSGSSLRGEIPSRYAQYAGYQVKTIPYINQKSDQEVQVAKDALQQGIPVVMGLAGGELGGLGGSSSGHYLVAQKLQSDGKVLINNPGRNNSPGNEGFEAKHSWEEVRNADADMYVPVKSGKGKHGRNKELLNKARSFGVPRSINDITWLSADQKYDIEKKEQTSDKQLDIVDNLKAGKGKDDPVWKTDFNIANNIGSPKKLANLKSDSNFDITDKEYKMLGKVKYGKGSSNKEVELEYIQSYLDKYKRGKSKYGRALPIIAAIGIDLIIDFIIEKALWNILTRLGSKVLRKVFFKLLLRQGISIPIKLRIFMYFYIVKEKEIYDLVLHSDWKDIWDLFTLVYDMYKSYSQYIEENNIVLDQATIDSFMNDSISISDLKNLGSDLVSHIIQYSKSKFGFGKGKYGKKKIEGNSEEVFKALIDKGFSKKSAAGIMGNWKQESSYYTDIVEGGWDFPSHMDTVPPAVGKYGEPGYGLAQWTSPDRKEGLKNYAASIGKPVYDSDAQIGWTIEELNNRTPGLLQKMDNAKDAGEAAYLFHRDFEVSNDTPAQIANRMQWANDAYNNEGKGMSDGNSSVANSSSTSSDNNSESQEKGFFSGLIDKMNSIYAPIKGAISKLYESFGPMAEKIFGKENLDFLYGGNIFSQQSSTPTTNDSTNTTSSDSKPTGTLEITDAPQSGSAAESIIKMMGNPSITSHWGPRMNGSDFHDGIDIGVDAGTKVPCPVDGVVDGVGGDTSTGYGLWVVIKDNNGYYHIFGHNSKNNLVKTGDNIKAGTIIAISGYTGHCIPAGEDGAHVHYGIYPPSQPGCTKSTDHSNPNSINPETYKIDGLASKPSGQGKWGRYKKIKIKPTGFTNGSEFGSEFGKAKKRVGDLRSWDKLREEYSKYDQNNIPQDLRINNTDSGTVANAKLDQIHKTMDKPSLRKKKKYHPFRKISHLFHKKSKGTDAGIGNEKVLDQPIQVNSNKTILQMQQDKMDNKLISKIKKLRKDKTENKEMPSTPLERFQDNITNISDEDIDKMNIDQLKSYYETMKKPDNMISDNIPDFNDDTVSIIKTKIKTIKKIDSNIKENMGRCKTGNIFGKGKFEKLKNWDQIKEEYSKYNEEDIDDDVRINFDEDSGTEADGKLTEIKRRKEEKTSNNINQDTPKEERKLKKKKKSSKDINEETEKEDKKLKKKKNKNKNKLTDWNKEDHEALVKIIPDTLKSIKELIEKGSKITGNGNIENKGDNKLQTLQDQIQSQLDQVKERMKTAKKEMAAGVAVEHPPVVTSSHIPVTTNDNNASEQANDKAAGQPKSKTSKNITNTSAIIPQINNNDKNKKQHSNPLEKLGNMFGIKSKRQKEENQQIQAAREEVTLAEKPTIAEEILDKKAKKKKEKEQPDWMKPQDENEVFMSIYHPKEYKKLKEKQRKEDKKLKRNKNKIEEESIEVKNKKKVQQTQETPSTPDPAILSDDNKSKKSSKDNKNKEPKQKKQHKNIFTSFTDSIGITKPKQQNNLYGMDPATQEAINNQINKNKKQHSNPLEKLGNMFGIKSKRQKEENQQIQAAREEVINKQQQKLEMQIDRCKDVEEIKKIFDVIGIDKMSDKNKPDFDNDSLDQLKEKAKNHIAGMRTVKNNDQKDKKDHKNFLQKGLEKIGLDGLFKHSTPEEKEEKAKKKEEKDYNKVVKKAEKKLDKEHEKEMKELKKEEKSKNNDQKDKKDHKNFLQKGLEKIGLGNLFKHSTPEEKEEKAKKKEEKDYNKAVKKAEKKLDKEHEKEMKELKKEEKAKKKKEIKEGKTGIYSQELDEQNKDKIKKKKDNKPKEEKKINKIEETKEKIKKNLQDTKDGKSADVISLEKYKQDKKKPEEKKEDKPPQKPTPPTLKQPQQKTQRVPQEVKGGDKIDQLIQAQNQTNQLLSSILDAILGKSNEGNSNSPQPLQNAPTTKPISQNYNNIQLQQATQAASMLSNTNSNSNIDGGNVVGKLFNLTEARV